MSVMYSSSQEPSGALREKPNNRKERRNRREDGDGGGNIFAGQAIANKEITGRPGFGKIGDLSDGGIGFRGVRQ